MMILCCFYLLIKGRGICFDGIEEITKASAEAHRVFFHQFCERFAKKFYDEYVYLPRTEDEKIKMKKILSNCFKMMSLSYLLLMVKKFCI